MTEQDFRAFVGETLESLFDQIDRLPVDDIDPVHSAGVVSCAFEDLGGTYVLSQQVPVQELWLSANMRAWHFCYDPAREGWYERDSDEAMLPLLSKLFSDKLGIPVTFR
ncbi:MAG: iron donor protein CyaY [Alphaproteobacteria bacterium]|nr:iron donor protein CyaY [Alphaproteobacteria bacterium]MCB9793890.1 iron donor protein CyaY [Alphaproteobacteria bacterium]